MFLTAGRKERKAMEKTAVSIILPVYNVEKYLKDSLNSIFRQTFRNFELICVDDGSTDSSGKILDELAANNPVMQVFHTENHGLSAARNYGMTFAKGEYIVFIDSDDSVTPDYLEIFYNEMKENHSDLVACGRKMVPGIRDWEKASPVAIQRFEGDIFGRFLRKEFRLGVEAYGAMYRRSILPDAPYYPGLFYEDYCFFFTEYFKNLKKISIVDADCYMITKSVNSIMRSSYSAKKMDSSFTILREVQKHIGNFDPAYHKKIFYRTQNNIIHRVLRDLLGMAEGENKDALFLQFKDSFLDALQKGSIKISFLKFKYKILALAVLHVKNMSLFKKAAKILF